MELKQLGKKFNNKLAGKNNEKCVNSRRIGGIRIKARTAAIDNTIIERVNSPTAFPFFQTDSQQEDTPASKVAITQLVLLISTFGF